MVVPSLYRSFERSNSKQQKFPVLISNGKYFPLLVSDVKSFPFSYAYLFFKLDLIDKKKGALKTHPPRCYQSTTNTLVELTFVNPRS
jgi:hypothetical protein